MAQVDLSNAILEPILDQNNKPPYYQYYISLWGVNTQIGVYDSSGTSIANNISRQKLIDVSNQLLVQISGTFTASGTEFYLGLYSTPELHYRISNVSFSSGDTFIFQIKANLA